MFLGKNSIDIDIAEADKMDTLRITIITAVILTGIVIIFDMVFGVHNDERIKQFLDSPSIREKFENSANNEARSSKKRKSPLVQQAEAFASYLNPKSKIQEARPVPRAIDVIRRLAITPKFKLLGTSYCKKNPKLSLALIDEPSKGQRWVRQFSEVDHFRIEQIKDGLIVVKNYEETFELTVQPHPEASKLIIEVPLPPEERPAGSS